MAHNRRKNRLVDTYEPERREEVLSAFWEAVAAGDDLDLWCSEPWRDGRHAARLCLALNPLVDRPEARWLEGVIGKPHSELTVEEYEQAEQLRYEVSRTDVVGRMLEAALAIYGNWIARSDGGGTVPNVHLASAIGHAIYSGDLREDVALEAVGLWRSRDAGMDWSRIGDGSPEGVAAATHRWLWMNRRYEMAYVFARSRNV